MPLENCRGKSFFLSLPQHLLCWESNTLQFKPHGYMGKEDNMLQNLLLL